MLTKVVKVQQSLPTLWVPVGPLCFFYSMRFILHLFNFICFMHFRLHFLHVPFFFIFCMYILHTQLTHIARFLTRTVAISQIQLNFDTHKKLILMHLRWFQVRENNHYLRAFGALNFWPWKLSCINLLTNLMSVFHVFHVYMPPVQIPLAPPLCLSCQSKTDLTWGEIPFVSPTFHTCPFCH